MKAIIPAAGLGTRMLPATKSMPKEMLPVLDKPVIQYVVEEAVEAGFDEILIITGRGKRAIEDHFDHSFELESFLKAKGKDDQLKQMEEISDLAEIHYVRQKEPLGLGHAVRCGKTFVGGDTFGVLLGDDIFLGNPSPSKVLRNCQAEMGGSVLAVMEVLPSQISRYGAIQATNLDAAYIQVEGMVEKPAAEAAPSFLAAMGRYVFEPNIFSILDSQIPGFGGEIQLTDAMCKLARQGKLGAVRTSSLRLDVGSLEGFVDANILSMYRRGGDAWLNSMVARCKQADKDSGKANADLFF